MWRVWQQLTKTNDKTDKCRERSRHRFSPAWLIHILIYYLRRIAAVFRRRKSPTRKINSLTKKRLSTTVTCHALLDRSNQNHFAPPQIRAQSLANKMLLYNLTLFILVARIRTWRTIQFRIRRASTRLRQNYDQKIRSLSQDYTTRKFHIFRELQDMSRFLHITHHRLDLRSCQWNETIDVFIRMLPSDGRKNPSLTCWDELRREQIRALHRGRR